ncbi:bifunctional methylenetetrahydrofolate dehydrogenase/methenyltetrahydrofolate cyclohydrolase FolD [Mailhella massiliensis]|uniref:Bifunctional protein FolD n=1 Tax=Mailhella massiliensis TaxID=1903261 RepID=A0A921AV15_9BACT|nr:bifunctional methylenetetrahydrofolate dehydrogenase/methenyltetrahydrofolate cyclohydrolase FolD [Mailhella massiliensis]HJD96374.1 bifunctional methylenetetrahydrofolate dehydrogenase/methenyltetrahydrofolate cyclohydrolase FolD [Mailhella massiliensis]
MILDGKATAAAIRAALREKIEKDREKAGRAPCLAVVLVGEDPASQVYVRNKEKACAEAGIDTASYRKPASMPQKELEDFLASLNADPAIDGILLQLPLPEGLDARPCIDAISPEKDVDGLTAVNQGRVAMNVPGLRPCTPAGILAILDRYGISVSGKKAVVIGRSNLVGRPIALMLGSRDYNATVTMCHSRTPDLAAVCREADIIVAALGRPRFITADMVKPGAVIIDVGINRGEDGRLCGDVDYENVAPLASAITPVPGGIGPMTISQLLVNTEKAWRRKLLEK